MTSPVQFRISNPFVGQLSSNDDVIRFLPIPFDWNELKTWGKCQIVPVVKMLLLICSLAYLGQSVTLTSGDLRSKLPSDLSGSKSI